jgi:hypothetical protein
MLYYGAKGTMTPNGRGRTMGFARRRRKMGVVAQAVYQSVDNPNDVTVTHDFHSLEQAKTFAGSPALKSAMEKSGVTGRASIGRSVGDPYSALRQFWLDMPAPTSVFG